MLVSSGQTHEQSQPRHRFRITLPSLRGGRSALPLLAPSALPIVLSRDGEPETLESESIVAVFRTVILLVALYVPRIFGTSLSYNFNEVALGAVAGIYNIVVGLTCLYPSRYSLRRPFVIATDTLLITLWIRLSQQWDLFSLYYIVVIVAAMWFRVFGGVVVAIFCSFFFLFLWGRAAGNPGAPAEVVFSSTYAMNIALLLLVGCLVGYIAEAQERERLRRLESQLLVSNYQREIDLATQLQPLLFTAQWQGHQNGDSSESAVAGHGEQGKAGGTANSGIGSISSKGGRTSAATLRPDPGLQLGAAMKTARSAGGGDYFDVLPMKGGRTALCIADVSGKSVRAQARLPLLKYSLRALAPLYTEPGDLLTRLNETLSPDLHDDLFIGLCYIVLDPQKGQLTWCNAGHIAPLLMGKPSPAGEGEEQTHYVTTLETTGPALGPFPEIPYSSRTHPWREGDRLLLYTDGLSDALSYGGTEDGEEQVRNVAAALENEQWIDPQAVAQRLVDMAGAVFDGNVSMAEHLSNRLYKHGQTSLAGALRLASSDSDVDGESGSNHRDDVTVVIAHYTTQEVPAKGQIPAQ